MKGLRRWHAGLSLRARALAYTMGAAPLVWLLAVAITAHSAYTEIDELFDSQLVRIARQVQTLLPAASLGALDLAAGTDPAHPAGSAAGAAELEDLSVAVWTAEGQMLLADREGVDLPHLADAAGFRDLKIHEDLWRVYYLQSSHGNWLVAVGQSLHERDELVAGLLLAQILPWLLMLPLLLLAMGAALRSALKPLDSLSRALAQRDPQGLDPLPAAELPPDLRPLVEAMNSLFVRIDSTLARERQFTADAAHELRTPLAGLRAQWDAARLQGGATGPGLDKIGLGLDRLARLVQQMLALARVEHLDALGPVQAVDWSAVVATVIDGLWPQAEAAGVDLEVLDLRADTLPLQGDAALLGVLLRNLLDNALRHAPRGSTVTLQGGPGRLSVLDRGPGVTPEQLARLGDRFYRPEGQTRSGSGLGLSIVRRIAALHGLAVTWGPRDDGPGFAVHLRRA